MVQPLQHLRRFVKLEHLPSHLQDQLSRSSTDQVAEGSIHSRESGDHPDNVTSAASNRACLYLLICATTDLAFEHVQTLVAPSGLPSRKGLESSILSITVAGLPPTSEAQARQWSQDYWPTIYKKHNPFGAHPAIISNATAEIEGNVGEFMDLARKAGQEASDACVGESIGAVVVDRSEAGRPIIVMVSGDARWSQTGKRREQECGPGNVMAHAVMRAVGLIAKKRRDVSLCPPAVEHSVERDVFSDNPLTSLEAVTYTRSSIEPSGYLCLDLEFYLTHEPCVMCSMALLHSRVGRVIFERQMIFTGGLFAGVNEYQAKDTQGLGYGLFWRPSLNWKFLTWQWTSAKGSSLRSIEKLHA